MMIKCWCKSRSDVTSVTLFFLHAITILFVIFTYLTQWRLCSFEQPAAQIVAPQFTTHPDHQSCSKVTFRNAPKHLEFWGILVIGNETSGAAREMDSNDVIATFGNKHPVLKVQNYWVYNPSILELSNGKHIFSGRMSWVHTVDCEKMRGPDGNEFSSDFSNCMFHNKFKFSDHTVFGVYDAVGCEGDITLPKAGDGARTTERMNDDNSKEYDDMEDIRDWKNGAGWWDTKFLYPFDHLFPVDDNKPSEMHNLRSARDALTAPKPKILMTSQHTENIFSTKWSEIEGSGYAALQLMFISTFEPDLVLSSQQHQSPETSTWHHHGKKKKKKMSRFYFFDPVRDHEELITRRRSPDEKWNLQAVDFAKALCKPRPSTLPPLPFEHRWWYEDEKDEQQGSEKYNQKRRLLHGEIQKGNGQVLAMNHLYSMLNTSMLLGFDETAAPPPPQTGRASWSDGPKDNANTSHDNHRRLAALDGDGQLFTLKDKNWSPFIYKNNKLLWSYQLEPHVVCENDIDLMYDDFDDADIECVICVKKYNSSNPTLFDHVHARIQNDGFEAVKVHLNGVPAFHIPNRNVYLGVMHVIKSRKVLLDNSRGAGGGGFERRSYYEHYFYKTAPEPPFNVIGISNNPIPLERARGEMPWFELNHYVGVEFISGMQYLSERIGGEIVLNFGVADNHAQMKVMDMDDVWKLF